MKKVFVSILVLAGAMSAQAGYDFSAVYKGTVCIQGTTYSLDVVMEEILRDAKKSETRGCVVKEHIDQMSELEITNLHQPCPYGANRFEYRLSTTCYLP